MARIDTGSGDNRPALALGMHCRADFPARILDGALTVPRHAIYDNQWVYVVEPDTTGQAGRLVRRRVPLLRSFGDRVLVDYNGRKGTQICELSPGDSVVVSPLIKPVDGMRVRIRDAAVASGDGAGPLGFPPGALHTHQQSFLSSTAYVLGRKNDELEGG